jgi:thiol-disulfide isomerase/thioredoxin
VGVRHSRFADHFRPARPAETGKVQFFQRPKSVTPLTMQTIDGYTLSPADWKGKVVIVNFWATWCPPCRAEIPDLIKLQDKYRDRLQIIGVSEDEDEPEAVKRFAAQYRINYPIVMSTPEIKKNFTGIYALPTSFIVDPQLRIVQKHVGLLQPVVTEQETRVLAGLSKNVAIEYVEDSDQALIKNAAQATDIPGIELGKLSSARKTAVLKKLNADSCTCGCGLTLAACRINDPQCGISLPLAMKIVKDVEHSSDQAN